MPEVEATRVAERVLALARVPFLDGLRPEQLPMLARAGREQVFPRRTVLGREGERMMSFHVPLTGRMALLRQGNEWEPAGPIVRLLMLGLLARRAMPAELVAEAGTVAFVLDLDALQALLDENGRLSRHLLRALAVELRAVQHVWVWTRRVSGTALPTGGDLVLRMLVLRETLGLGIDGMALVSRLARSARELHLGPGMAAPPVSERGDVLVVSRGHLRLDLDDGTTSDFDDGAVIGLSEAVASMPCEGRMTALVPTSGLLIPYSELTEAIADDDLVCLELIRAFASELWERLDQGSPAAAAAAGGGGDDPEVRSTGRPRRLFLARVRRGPPQSP